MVGGSVVTTDVVVLGVLVDEVTGLVVVTSPTHLIIGSGRSDEAVYFHPDVSSTQTS